MAPSTTIGLKLKHPQMVYYSGQCILGTVTIKIKEQNQAIDLIIELIGKSMCSYPHKPRHSSTVEMKKEHIIVQHGKIVSSPKAGKHDIDFQFNLPNGIPGSVDLDFGSIFYELTAKYGDNIVSRPVSVITIDSHNETKVSDLEATFKKGFTEELVVKEANVETVETTEKENSYSSALGCESVVSSCLGMVRGDIGANMRLMKGVYCPGEGIVARVDAYNNVNVNTRKLRLSLVQTIKYITDKHTKITTTKVVSVYGPKVLKNGGSAMWESDPLRIPFVAPTTRDEVISVEYDVRLRILLHFCSGVELICPVFIGGLKNLNEIGGRRSHWQLHSTELQL